MADRDRTKDFKRVYDEWTNAILDVRAKYDVKREELTDAMGRRMEAGGEDPAAVVADTMEARSQLEEDETSERRKVDAEFKARLESMRGDT